MKTAWSLLPLADAPRAESPLDPQDLTQTFWICRRLGAWEPGGSIPGEAERSPSTTSTPQSPRTTSSTETHLQSPRSAGPPAGCPRHNPRLSSHLDAARQPNGDEGEHPPGKVHAGLTSSSPRPRAGVSPRLCPTRMGTGHSLCSPALLQTSPSLLPGLPLLSIALLIS